MNQPINKILILKYLNGECNAAELELRDAFLLRDDAQQLIDQVWNGKLEAYQEREISDQEISLWKDRFFKESLIRDAKPNKTLHPVKRL